MFNEVTRRTFLQLLSMAGASAVVDTHPRPTTTRRPPPSLVSA
ncbi:MAG: twin-arginine translocation signal domain-containing protein [Luteitalea sp.]|nr:twin-arginine translocation signal domain-containing protein [Luteitalea sp.]